jgi:O-antigen/teichoic acid export membrane protein
MSTPAEAEGNGTEGLDAGLPGAESTPPAVPAPPPRKGIGRQALIYGFGEILNRAVSFVMLPLYTSYLSPADYGVVSLVDMTFSLVAIVAGARLTAGIFRFYHKADTKEERNVVISTALLLILGTYLVVSSLGFAFAANLSQLIFNSTDHADVLQLAAVSFLLQGAMAVPFAYLTAAEEPNLLVAVNAAKLVMQATLNYVFLAHLHLGVRSVFTSGVIANAIFFALLGWYQIRATGFGFSRDVAKQLIRFWWPLVFTQVALFVLTYGDRYFLQRAGGETAVGLYALAYNFGFLLVAIGFSPFSRVWDSVRFRLAKEMDADRDKPFSRAFVDVNILMFGFGTAIMLFIRPFLALMSAPAFHSAADIVPVILVAYILQCWAMMQDVGVMVRERTGWNTLANVLGAIVALAGYILLIPRYLGYGAAWATLVSFAVRWIVLYIASQRLWPIKYQWSLIVRVIVFSSVVSGAGFVLSAHLATVPAIAANIGLSCAYLAGLWNLGVISDEMREKIRTLSRGVTARLAHS